MAALPVQKGDHKLRQFHQQVAKLKAEADKCGLGRDDIEDCLLTALDSKRKPSTKHLAVRHWLLKSCQAAILLAAILILFYILIRSHKPTKQYFTSLAFNSSYHVLRGMRILSLPVARRFDLNGLYHAACVIPNPWFSGNVPIDCIPCRVVSQVPVVTEPNVHGLGSPFIYQDHSIKRFTFQEMKTWHLMNQGTFSSVRDDHVQSSNPFIQATSELFTEDRQEEDILRGPFSLEWRAASAGSVRLVRNLFGKPSFIPSNSEVQPEMFVVIESPSSHAHFLPRPTHHGSTWLAQAHGSREISLTPVPTCKHNCTEFTLVLEAGNALFFDSMYWQLMSFPFGADVSISCIGSFY